MVSSIGMKLIYVFCVVILLSGINFLDFISNTFAFTCDTNPCFGTDDNNKIAGTSSNEIIFGKGGNDEITGSNGNDKVYGGSGDDVVGGSNGNDEVSGGPGIDIVFGNAGEDKLDGGVGNDRVYANDNFQFSDGLSDHIKCGPGTDTAYLNPSEGDIASNDCETKKIP